jgi:hypothetical protein
MEITLKDRLEAIALSVADCPEPDYSLPEDERNAKWEADYEQYIVNRRKAWCLSLIELLSHTVIGPKILYATTDSSIDLYCENQETFSEMCKVVMGIGVQGRKDPNDYNWIVKFKIGMLEIHVFCSREAVCTRVETGKTIKKDVSNYVDPKDLTDEQIIAAVRASKKITVTSEQEVAETTWDCKPILGSVTP